ncbi:MAG: hypothetical protein Q9M09_04110 [Mariprofundaceae bacterium]|nr:hypothetical protein [Mariprofundaceae bacterium]
MNGDFLPTSTYFQVKIRSMETACISFFLENEREVGWQLIHPDFCLWLIGKVLLNEKGAWVNNRWVVER